MTPQINIYGPAISTYTDVKSTPKSVYLYSNFIDKLPQGSEERELYIINGWTSLTSSWCD